MTGMAEPSQNPGNQYGFPTCVSEKQIFVHNLLLPVMHISRNLEWEAESELESQYSDME